MNTNVTLIGCFVTKSYEFLPVAEACGAEAGHSVLHALHCVLLRSQPEVMTLENLSELLQIPVNTLRADLHRSPETLPRRLYLPGRRIVRFLRADVAAWLLASASNGGVIVNAANDAAARGTL